MRFSERAICEIGRTRPPEARGHAPDHGQAMRIRFDAAVSLIENKSTKTSARTVT
jgi:hypothetical protein